MGQQPLNPYERETTILMNDLDDFALVCTYQRKYIGQLRKIVAASPDAKETTTEPLKRYGGASFRIPAKLVNLRMPRRESARSRMDAKTAADRMAKARAAKGKA